MAATNPQPCATCHVKEGASQPSTPMGLALSGIHSAKQPNRDLTFTNGKFTYRVETRNGLSTYTVSDGDRTLSLPVQWTFGAGSQTWLLGRDGGFIESMVSYYPETGGLDITLGDQGLHPQNLEEAVGRPLTSDGVTTCFGCHSTNSGAGHKFSLESVEPGVTCARCHTGAAPHAVSMAGGGAAKSLPERLGRQSAESISSFCGQCHRTWETVVRNNWRGVSNVRFQPYRLANSKCFDGSDARISCLACHNPHQDLVRGDAAKYDAKCEACHGSSAKRCIVSQTGCVSCHMPKVQLPGGHQTFTDHDIRIVKPGEAYPD